MKTLRVSNVGTGITQYARGLKGLSTAELLAEADKLGSFKPGLNRVTSKVPPKKRQTTPKDRPIIPPDVVFRAYASQTFRIRRPDYCPCAN